MYEELISMLRGVADADLANMPVVRFKRRLLDLLRARRTAFMHCHLSTLEACVASMAVELPMSLQNEQVDELAELYARIVERLYAATVQVGYTNVDAAFRLQAEKLSLKLSD
jgi:hypothetical protein